MCGIAGLINLSIVDDIQDNNHKSELEFINKKLSHRGDEKFKIKFFPNKNFFYHNRLSIIDLNDRSKQPMSDFTDQYYITFNGEIYNYKELRSELIASGVKFKTESDTEVLLNSYIYWGENFIQRINGMFAFAIYDLQKNKFLIFRDRFGIKPLYYSVTNKQLKFASESQALTYLDNSIEINSVNTYLLGMFLPGKLSFFKNVHKLLPGHFLKFENEKISLNEYYSVEDNLNETPKELNFSKTEKILNKTINEHLHSDVKNLNFLSSGLDSSLILKYSTELKSIIKSISLNYQNDKNQEGKKAKEFAKQLKVSNSIINVSSYIYLLNFYRVFKNINEPIADSAIVANFILSKYAKNNGFKVVINGSGGDEIFCGYKRYRNLDFKRIFFYSILNLIPINLLKFLNILSYEKLLRLKNNLYEMFIAASGCPKVINLLYDKNIDKKKFLNNVMESFPTIKNYNFNQTKSRMVSDIKINLSENLNALFDQATMLNTVEGRVPFQDKNIIEYFLNSKSVKNNKAHQHVLMSKKLGKDFIYNKKGFGAPVNKLIIEKKQFFMSLLKRGAGSKHIHLNIIKYCKMKINNSVINNQDAQLIFRTCAFIIWENNQFQN